MEKLRLDAFKSEHVGESAVQKQLSRLRESSRDLQEMLLTLAHDLKDPLVTIRGFCQLLHNDLQSKKIDREVALRRLSIIQNAASSIQLLVQNLSAFTRFSNRADEVLEQVDARKLISGVVTTLQSAIDQTNTQVCWNPKAMPKVQSDSLKLYHIFLNLISNAIHHGQAKRPKIEIRYQHDPRYHVFTIRDNGCGIPKEKQKEIFKPFTQLRRTDHGSGLGLAIVKRILDDMDGFITLKSSTGKGSTFTFGFPIFRSKKTRKVRSA